MLVADWQRHPALASDPDLIEELAEAQSELGRCREIVSNILHSAGHERGEAMAPMDVPALLKEVVTSWREVHADVPIVFHQERLEGTRVAAEPALRQAIWSLLENAADASPSGVTLAAESAEDRLTISVRDQGPGFSAEQLERIGQLYQSSKGAGRGLGLFLASNVARRLGGSLKALNLEEGGAEVRLTLPLASVSAE